MMKHILIAVGLVAATLTLQTPAQAGGSFSISFGKGHGFHKGFHSGFHHRGFRSHRGFRHRSFRGHRGFHLGFQGNRGFHRKTVITKLHSPHGKKHVVKETHYKKPVKEHYGLSNREIRKVLKKRGLYNIRFVDRHDGFARVVAHNTRGYIGKYKIDTHTGKIMKGRVVKYY